MNPRNFRLMASEMKALRESVDRIRYTHAQAKCEAAMNVPHASKQIVDKLRLLETAFTKCAIEDEATLPMAALEHREPIREAPQPKRKPGRPRKTVPPAEAGGVI